MTTVCRSVAEAADRPYSHVVVTTKAIPDLYRTPQILAPLLAPGYSGKYPQPTYVLFQNGLNVEVDLFNAIKALGKGDPKIIGMAVYIATNLLDDNVVEHSHYVCSVRILSSRMYIIDISTLGPRSDGFIQSGPHYHNQYSI